MGSTTQDDSDDDEEEDAVTPSKRPGPGRPTLSPEGRLEFEELKARRRFLSKKCYEEKLEAEKQDKLSEKRRTKP